MNYIKLNRNIFFLFTAAAFFAAIFTFPENIRAQERSYEFLPMPDVWYNSVDGIRAGVRIKGQTPGSYGDGPHRLNLGIWVGSKLPANPVSYYISFTEPISAISDFGSEGSIRLRSSIRTGFQRHGISFNKRWQTGFNEFNYKQLEIGARAENRFNNDYLLYPQLWQENWLYITHATFDLHNEHSIGRYWLNISIDANIAGSHPGFVRSQIQYQQQVPLGDLFEVRGRLYGSLASDETAPEYLFMQSMAPAVFWMENGFTRARGTIPPSWFQNGNVQIAEGPNLRGYVHQEARLLNETGQPPLYTSAAATNVEFEYPNPIDSALQNISMVGEFLRMKSYLFYDGGISRAAGLPGGSPQQEFISDAGLGFLFSFNIPDHLGQRSGVVLRYDLPLWLSHSGDEKAFKFRNVIGIGAVISL